MIHYNVPKAARDASKVHFVELLKNLKDCKVKEIEAKAENNDPSRHQVLNHIESAVLKKT